MTLKGIPSTFAQWLGRCLPVTILIVAPVVAGCASQSRSLSTSSSMGHSPLGNAQSTSSSLAEAEQMIKSKDYELAIPRLVQLIAKKPDSNAAVEGRYLLGVAYVHINSVQDAIGVFDEYLSLAPQGPHAQEVKEYVAKLKAEYEKKYPNPDELDARIKTAMKQVQTHPGDDNAQLNLADLLWKRGDYDTAGKIYIKLLNKDPNYGRKPEIAQRIEHMPDGQYIVLTPSEIERRSIESRPLEIVNTYTFRSGEDLLTREKRFYVVTGQAYNRGDSILYGVQVHVTIYGFGNVIYDTATVNIGRLNPKEKRAFSVRFSNFDNIENVARYDCVGTFER